MHKVYIMPKVYNIMQKYAIVFKDMRTCKCMKKKQENTKVCKSKRTRIQKCAKYAKFYKSFCKGLFLIDTNLAIK